MGGNEFYKEKKKENKKKETISLLPPAGVDNNPLSYWKNKHLHLEDSYSKHLKYCDPRHLQ